MDMTIEEFCDKYKACSSGRKYALNNYSSMQDFWDNTKSHEYLMWCANKVLNKKDRVKYGCWCVRQLWHVLKDERSKNAIVIAEKYSIGDASDSEIASSFSSAARAAAIAYASYASGNYDISSAAAAYASCSAASAVEGDAAAAAVAAAAFATAFAACDSVDTGRSQMKFLRENFTPNFEKGN